MSSKFGQHSMQPKTATRPSTRSDRWRRISSTSLSSRWDPSRKRYSTPASSAARRAGAVDQRLGLLLGEGHEVAPPDLEEVIDEALEGRSIGGGEVALEDDAIEAGEHGDDRSGQLGDGARQRLHGVLRW